MKIKLTQDQFLGLLRHSLTFIGGYLLWQGKINETTEAQLIGSAMGFAGVIWSIWNNSPLVQQARLLKMQAKQEKKPE